MLDTTRIKDGISTINSNIEVLEESIDQDRKRIREYQSWLDTPNCGGYKRESLESGIQQLKVNIVTVETAIEGERQRIKELRHIEGTLERKHMEQEIAKQNIVIKH